MDLRWYPIEVVLEDGKSIILNEGQVSELEPGENGIAIITMSSGNVRKVIDPPYNAWKNDILQRKS